MKRHVTRASSCCDHNEAMSKQHIFQLRTAERGITRFYPAYVLTRGCDRTKLLHFQRNRILALLQSPQLILRGHLTTSSTSTQSQVRQSPPWKGNVLNVEKSATHQMKLISNVSSYDYSGAATVVGE